MYGEVMYAIAAGAIVAQVVQFGLYYALVTALGSAGENEGPGILNRANVIKAVLTAVSMAAVVIMAFFRGFSVSMGLILFLIALGFALEAVAETFFAGLRVRGRQDKEARIKIIGSLVSHGYGLLAAAVGLPPVMISLFKVISGTVRIWFGIGDYISHYASGIRMAPRWGAVWNMFRAALVFAMIDILGIIYNKTNVFFLENATGVKGVAYYSATWILVDPVSVVASEQLLGWVIFPLLASLWWSSRDQVRQLVRRNAQWLMVMAFPIMFFLYAEAGFLIGLIYPAEYKDAVWMQQYLVWTILFSFESNLFRYVMMVAGAANILLVFQALGTILNLVFNWVLVKPFGLAGGCLVIILTKLVMMVMTFLYCQLRFHFFRWYDFLFPIVLAVVSLGLFALVQSVAGLHPAVTLSLAFYFLVLWRIGPRFLGHFPRKGEVPEEKESGH
jgi:O-antigen/teichoic acid export membrane protein